MSDHTEETNSNGESFAEMLESHESGMNESVRVGDKITGKVISIDGTSIFVSTGTKIDGVIDRDELLNEEGELPVAEGDEVTLYAVSVTPGEIRLSRAVSGEHGAEALREAFESGLPVEGKVTGTCKGGFNVEMMKRRVFCPVSQIDDRFVENAEDYVGQSFQFLIIKFEQNGRNIVASRRELLNREKAEKAATWAQEAKEGDVVEGTVARLAKFGAFVTLDAGVDGLVHVSELGWSRVDNPAEAVKVGDRVTAKIVSIDTDNKGQLKVGLSIKQTEQDPWKALADQVKAGDKVPGKVVRLADFGAFVEILPGIDGLVHISELTYTKRVHKPDEVVQVGDAVTVLVKDIDFEKKRVSLSLRDAEGDPWAEVPEKFKVGTTVTGTVEKRAQFGMFINLDPGVTGLLPKSRISRSSKGKDVENLAPGSELEVIVEELNVADRKITLALEASDGAHANEAADWKKYAKPAGGGGRKPRGDRQPSSTSIGDSGGLNLLGDKLAEAMKKKK